MSSVMLTPLELGAVLLAVFVSVFGFVTTTIEPSEREISTQWCRDVMGGQPARLANGREVDCLTGELAIEVERERKRYEPVGQAAHYARMTGKRPAIAFIAPADSDCTEMRSTIADVERLQYRMDSGDWVSYAILVIGPGCKGVEGVK